MSSVRVITKTRVGRWLPRRRKEAHKGDCGRVYILAGSRGMVGAAVLVAEGALRAGAGLVRLAVVKSQQQTAAHHLSPEVMTQALPETGSGHLAGRAWNVIEDALRKFRPTLIAAGPGLGVSRGSTEVIRHLLGKTPLPLVLDADGLNGVQGASGALRRPAPLIITPHPGELGRLLKKETGVIQKSRQEYVTWAANVFSCVCLLKGAGTLISDGKILWKNTTGNAGMASGGMGDVLTGLIAGFWGQMRVQDHKSALEAAALSAYLHGLAADLAVRETTPYSLSASHVIDFLPAAIKRTLRS